MLNATRSGGYEVVLMYVIPLTSYYLISSQKSTNMWL